MTFRAYDHFGPFFTQIWKLYVFYNLKMWALARLDQLYGQAYPPALQAAIRSEWESRHRQTTCSVFIENRKFQDNTCPRDANYLTDFRMVRGASTTQGYGYIKQKIKTHTRTTYGP